MIGTQNGKRLSKEGINNNNNCLVVAPENKKPQTIGSCRVRRETQRLESVGSGQPVSYREYEKILKMNQQCHQHPDLSISNKVNCCRNNHEVFQS